jgi:AcrR family transcriptional regulator
MPAVRGSRLKNGSPTVVSDPAAPLTAEAHPAEQLAHRASGETDRVSGESRRERHRREIFERLVDAARQLMFDRSLEDARIQDITDLADVGKGTFFNFFSAKELVVPEIVRERVQLLRQSVDRVKAGEVSSREVLNDFINPSFERKLTPTDWDNYYGSMIRSLAHDEVRSSISELLREEEQFLGYLVASGQERGEFPDDRDASAVAVYFLRAFLGLQLIAWIHGVGLNPDELEASARLTFDLLLPPRSPSAGARKAVRPTMTSSQRPRSGHTGRKRRSREGSR